MTIDPQVGDIWDWTDTLYDDTDGPILLLEFDGDNGITKYFRGLELLTGREDVFIFCNSNEERWRKVA